MTCIDSASHYTSPVPFSNLPCIQSFLPSLLKTAELQSTTLGNGTLFWYRRVISAVIVVGRAVDPAHIEAT